MPKHRVTARVRRALMNKQSKHTVDKMAYIISVVGNVAVLPQVIRAWSGPAPGLAVLTWILYAGFGCVWLIYALQRRQGALIVAQVTAITANVAVISGWLVNTYLH